MRHAAPRVRPARRRGRRIDRVLALASLGLASLLASASGQEAARPAVAVGDRWSFVVYHGLPATAPNRRWVVTAVTPEGIEATEDGQPLALTLDLNVRESPNRRESNTLVLQFPLSVGKAWMYETDTLFKDNLSTATTAARVRVVAEETVEVVAGRFRAFRLEAGGTFTGRSKGGLGHLAGEFRATYWYAPAARAIVKSELWSPYRGTTKVELVELQLNGSAGR